MCDTLSLSGYNVYPDRLPTHAEWAAMTVQNDDNFRVPRTQQSLPLCLSLACEQEHAVKYVIVDNVLM